MCEKQSNLLSKDHQKAKLCDDPLSVFSKHHLSTSWKSQEKQLSQRAKPMKSSNWHNKRKTTES